MSKTTKKNRIWGRQLNALIQIAFMAGILISASFYIEKISPRYDLSAQKEYSLSEYTENLLTKEFPEELILKATCLADLNSPYIDRITMILQEYERLSAGKIELTFIDPYNHPNEAFRVTDQYQIRPTGDLLILDGGSEKKRAFIPFSDLMEFEVNEYKQRKLSAYQTEDVLTTTILNLIEEKRRTVYLVSDNTKAENVAENSIGATLQALYRNQNVDLTPLNLSEVNEIPEDARGLVFLTPQYDLTPKDLKILTQYWQLPKSSLLFIFDPNKKPKKLNAFLRSHGVSLKSDRVFNLDGAIQSSKTVANFTQGAIVNQSLQGRSTIFDGVSSSLEVREIAEDLINKRIAPIALIQASKKHYSETRHSAPPFSFNEQEDTLTPVHLAAAVIKGNEMNDQTAANSSRLIALSTADFLLPDKIRDEQIDFMKNSINWLVGRPDLIGVGPKPLKRYKLNLVSAEITFINRLTLFILPVSFLLIGAFIWNLRRN